MSDGLTLAIMKNVGIGNRDASYPILWFEAYITESSAALQCLTWDQAKDLIKETGVYDVKYLEGRPCWVTVDRGLIQYVKPWK